VVSSEWENRGTKKPIPAAPGQALAGLRQGWFGVWHGPEDVPGFTYCGLAQPSSDTFFDALLGSYTCVYVVSIGS
jgi:hypothetical protein